jgi:glycosyltransferase involved in cell wall biosynthesis
MGMIVRNEEIDIVECLETFLPSVDFVSIVDTGSTDKTLQVAKAILDGSDVKYSLDSFFDASDSEGRLCDFSRARNEYVRHIEASGCDYLMSVDADDTLVTPDIKAAIRKNPADFYGIRYRMNENMFFNSYKIWRNGHGTRYQGRVHECLAVDWTKKIAELDVEFLHRYTHNPLQESGTDRNMRILKSEIYAPLRSLFYWANENVDAKNYHEAVKWYLEYIRRVNAGEATWEIELAHCYFRAARWTAYLGKVDQAIELSLELVKRDPSWSESWCELAHLAYCKGEYQKSFEYAVKARTNKFIPRLFSELDKYTNTADFLIEQARVKMGASRMGAMG